MISGKDKKFVPGKTFKFLKDFKAGKSNKIFARTRKCIECGVQKPKKLFIDYDNVCSYCIDKKSNK